VKKELEKFQKEMWSSTQPLLFAVEYVKSILQENEKLRAMITQLLEEKREEFINDVRSKTDFSNFEK